MKKTVIIFATLLFCFYLHAQQAGNDFYYYFGEKIFLTERADKMFIKLTENADTQSLLALMQADESICLDALNKQTFDLFVILETKNGESFSLGTVNKFRENPNIISTQLMLEYESDQLLAPTNEFTVKLKPATSFGQLQNLVTEHGCIIVRESQFVENQYIISIDVVETYLKENNYKEAMITLTKMYERFEITEEQAFELNDLGTYIHWLLQLE
ncbi:MAG: hypothetical protein FWC34_07605, partial [Bacteroidetes bacterium]|nr:hypothetical protein [Bacteroidota bacterium]